jgi:hypothetical protein
MTTPRFRRDVTSCLIVKSGWQGRIQLVMIDGVDLNTSRTWLCSAGCGLLAPVD